MPSEALLRDAEQRAAALATEEDLFAEQVQRQIRLEREVLEGIQTYVRRHATLCYPTRTLRIFIILSSLCVCW